MKTTDFSVPWHIPATETAPPRYGALVVSVPDSVLCCCRTSEDRECALDDYLLSRLQAAISADALLDGYDRCGKRVAAILEEEIL